MTQHKHQPLPIGQFAHGGLQPAPPFVLQHLIFGARGAGRQMLGRVPFHAVRINRRPGNPPLPPTPGLEAIQAPVNQDSCEPDLKWEVLAEGAHVGVGLHKRVLHSFVPVRRVAQIMKRNSSRSALMALDQGSIGFPRLVQLTGGLEGLHADCNRGVGFSAGFRNDDATPVSRIRPTGSTVYGRSFKVVGPLPGAGVVVPQD